MENDSYGASKDGSELSCHPSTGGFMLVTDIRSPQPACLRGQQDINRTALQIAQAECPASVALMSYENKRDDDGGTTESWISINSTVADTGTGGRATSCHRCNYLISRHFVPLNGLQTSSDSPRRLSDASSCNFTTLLTIAEDRFARQQWVAMCFATCIHVEQQSGNGLSFGHIKTAANDVEHILARSDELTKHALHLVLSVLHRSDHRSLREQKLLAGYDLHKFRLLRRRQSTAAASKYPRDDHHREVVHDDDIASVESEQLKISAESSDHLLDTRALLSDTEEHFILFGRKLARHYQDCETRKDKGCFEARQRHEKARLLRLLESDLKRYSNAMNTYERSGRHRPSELFLDTEYHPEGWVIEKRPSLGRRRAYLRDLRGAWTGRKCLLKWLRQWDPVFGSSMRARDRKVDASGFVATVSILISRSGTVDEGGHLEDITKRIALTDTCCPVNLIAEDKVPECLRSQVKPFQGRPLNPIGTQEVLPKAVISLKFKLKRRDPVYEAPFFVLAKEDRPKFDALLGYRWLREHGFELRHRDGTNLVQA